jgi:hypothetical protein
MELWMRLGQPLEDVIGDHERVLDAWEAGGVRGLVFGRAAFMPSPAVGIHAEAVPAFAPNESVYRALGVEPPPPPRESLPQRRAQLDRMLDGAKRRGWVVLIFEPAAFRGPGGDGNVMLDDLARRAYLARAQDTLEAFPQVDGAIVDGPEWPYEPASDRATLGPYARLRGRARDMFEEMPPAGRQVAARLGQDFDALAAAQRRLRDRLGGLDDATVARHATGGVLGGLGLLGYDPGIVDFLRFRMDALLDFVGALRAHLDGTGRRYRLGMGPRTASFGPVAGYDFARLAEPLDYLLPKHYFWHRGYDGMYGSWARWVQALLSWNPRLSEASAFAAVRALLGIEVPGVETLAGLDDGFPPSFFESYVADQTRRAIAATGDPERVVPWVDVGRLPHDGDPIPPGDLRAILRASAAAGLRRFLYHNHAHLSPAEWGVISELCGQRWPGPGAGGYCPPDGFHIHPTGF